MSIDMASANVFVAFWAGMLSFLSPCVLPLVPSYLGYMSGATVQKGTVQAPRVKVLLHALAFVLGFTVVFVLLFGIGTEVMRQIFSAFHLNYRLVLQWVGGIVMIFFGLSFLGLFKLPFLERTIRHEFHPDPRLGYARSFLIGLGFAAGCTPCIGPFLALLLGMSGDAAAVPLFVAYSLGLGVPFVLAALSMGQLTVWLRKFTRGNLNVVSIVSGVLLIFMGILLVTNQVTKLNEWFAPLLNALGLPQTI